MRRFWKPKKSVSGAAAAKPKKPPVDETKQTQLAIARGLLGKPDFGKACQKVSLKADQAAVNAHRIISKMQYFLVAEMDARGKTATFDEVNFYFKMISKRPLMFAQLIKESGTKERERIKEGILANLSKQPAFVNACKKAKVNPQNAAKAAYSFVSKRDDVLKEEFRSRESVDDQGKRFNVVGFYVQFIDKRAERIIAALTKKKKKPGQ